MYNETAREKQRFKKEKEERQRLKNMTNAFEQVQQHLNRLETAVNNGHDHQVQQIRVEILRIVKILAGE